MNGKGDKRRKTDSIKYNENYGKLVFKGSNGSKVIKESLGKKTYKFTAK